MAGNKRKIQILDNKVIHPAVIDSDSDSCESIFCIKKPKKELKTNLDGKSSTSGKFCLLPYLHISK